MMSTHQLVVRAVRAESADENEAATTPIVKRTTTVLPSWPVAANIGSRASPEAGNSIPSFFANSISSMPRDRNNRFAGTKAKP